MGLIRIKLFFCSLPVLFRGPKYRLGDLLASRNQNDFASDAVIVSARFVFGGCSSYGRTYPAQWRYYYQDLEGNYETSEEHLIEEWECYGRI